MNKYILIDNSIKIKPKLIPIRRKVASAITD